MSIMDPDLDAYELAHRRADTDNDRTSLHHTLGQSPTQASPGNHNHDADLDALMNEADAKFMPIDRDLSDLENQPFTEVPAGTTLKLKKGTTGPPAPVLTQDVPSVTVTNNGGIYEAGTVILNGWLYELKRGFGQIYRTPLAGGASYLEADIGATVWFAQAFTYLNNQWYVYGTDASSNGHIYIFDSNWLLLSNLSTPIIDSFRHLAMSHNGTNLLVYYARNSDNQRGIKVINATTGAVISTNLLGITSTDLVRSILYGNFDYGATRYVLTDDTQIYVFDSTFTRKTTEEWHNITGDNARSMGWDGTYFWYRGSTDKLYRYTKDMFTATADGDRKVGGVSLATAVGPYTSAVDFFTNYTVAKKRRRLKVSFATIASPIESYDLYIGKQTSTFMLQDPDTGDGTNVQYIEKPVLVGGTAPPGASTWPAGTPAKVISDNGTYYMDADGIIKPENEQGGTKNTGAFGAAATDQDVAVAFPRAFLNVPTVILLQPIFGTTASGGLRAVVKLGTVTVNGFTMVVQRVTGTGAFDVYWKAQYLP